MSRYIDAECLKYYGNHLDDEYEAMYHDVQWVYRYQIDSAPSIDIVRCKECKYCVDAGAQRALVCDNSYIDMDIHPDDFCSYGEREGE